MTITTTAIELPVPGPGTLPMQEARPSGEHRPVGVIVAHELFGVNPDIRRVLDKLAANGYLAVAPEFYHRDVAAGHWLQRDDVGRQEGFTLLHRMTRAGALADVGAAIDYLRAQAGINDIAMIGFSAGGHLAYLAATQLPIDRTIVLYGGWLASTDIELSRPGPTVTLTPGITGRLLYLVGGADALIDDAQLEQIRAALAGAGVDHEVIVYPGVQHAYFWPGTHTYQEAAASDSWDRILALLSHRSGPHRTTQLLRR
jgi:carboxymethylenebutenolidase